ncbi:MAG: hypothetical protein ACYDAQ_14545 [Mycobacteriales bacterium]
MSAYTAVAEKAGDQLISLIGKAQDVTTAAVRSAVSVVAKLPQPPAVPGADTLPKPVEIAEANLAFTKKLLAQQGRFVDQLLGVTQPAKAAKTAPRASK